jgi:hypothetical protein
MVFLELCGVFCFQESLLANGQFTLFAKEILAILGLEVGSG